MKAIIYLCIFLLMGSLQAAQFDGPNEKYFTVASSSRISNLDTAEYYFQIRLDNGQQIKIPAKLQDLLDEKIRQNTVVKLLKEDFIPDEPGYSLFNYATLDGEFVFEGKGASIYDHWHPSDNPIISVLSITYVRFGMSNFRHDIKFSDNSVISIPYLIYKPVFAVGDRFFKIKDNQVLVNVNNGKVMLKSSAWDQSYYIKMNWFAN